MLKLRYYKKIDNKNRMLIPSNIMKELKTKEFYLEYYEDGTIKLIPKKKGQKNEQ